MVYLPAEDSYLLEKELKSYLEKLDKEEKNKLKVLDMGSGSGIQALTCIKEGIKKSNIIAADLDKESIKLLKSKKLKTIHTNLFSKVVGKFDLIIFNAPYLPSDKYDNNLDTTAGKRGYETIIKFLRQAKLHLNKQGNILLLFSSLSKSKIILKEARKLKYNSEKLSEQGMGFFERLYVYKFELE